MISFEEARKRIESHCPAPEENQVFLLESLGRVNARDITSPVALPLFDNSAMDGFALRAGDTYSASPALPVFLPVRGVIKAGGTGKTILRKKETYRIMTGAPMASGADTVIAQEKAVVKDGFLIVSSPLFKGTHVRYRGEELKEGKVALPAGAVIHPGTVGFLASMGIHRLRVYRLPKVSLVATGSELVAAGKKLALGKIYDSNSPMIQAALEEMGLRPVLVQKLMDDPKTIEKVIAFTLKESDFVILTGGVSTGDYDFVKKALENLGVETILWKVSQKPGKPLYAGKKKKTLVFGLPGNPASVFTCFYEYVYPALRKSMGYPNPYLRSHRMKLGETVLADPDKTLFMKAKTGLDHIVTPLKHQQSHMLSSLCEADCLLMIPPLKEQAEPVVHSLPYALDTCVP